MDILEQRTGDIVVLHLSGRLDGAASPLLTARAAQSLDGGPRALLLDLDRLSYLTSEGFRTLLQVQRQAMQNHAELALCGLRGFALELFGISGLQARFETYASREEALTGLESKSRISAGTFCSAA